MLVLALQVLQDLRALQDQLEAQAVPLAPLVPQDHKAYLEHLPESALQAPPDPQGLQV